MGRRRGSVLVLALFIIMLLAVSATGLFWVKMQEHRSSLSFVAMNQAYSLAQAGLEDARTRLTKTITFAPLVYDSNSNPMLYSYARQVNWNGRVIGTYNVTVDKTQQATAPNFWMVTSIGMIPNLTNNPAQPPLAQRPLQAWLPVAPISAGSAVYAPGNGVYAAVRDLGSY